MVHRPGLKIEERIKQAKFREEASNKIKAAIQTKFTKQYKEAKHEHKVKDTGQPLVIKHNTRELIFKKNGDRGIRAQQATA